MSKLKQEIEYLKGLLSVKKKGGNEEDYDEQFKKKDKVEQNEEASMSQKDFEKLLRENRKMKKEIFLLQNHLQTGRS